MRDRGWRRDRTEHLARKRWRVWLDFHCGGDRPWATETPMGRFRKTKPFHCGCRKRKPSAPRQDIGMCDVGQRARIYRWRQEVRELRARLARRPNPRHRCADGRAAGRS